jgi:hypothetical protein
VADALAGSLLFLGWPEFNPAANYHWHPLYSNLAAVHELIYLQSLVPFAQARFSQFW